MAKPRKEVPETNFVETPTEKTYKKYNKYTLEVTPVMTEKRGEGKRFSHHIGRVVEILKKPGIASTNIAVDPIVAERMNIQWHNTKYYMFPVGERVPAAIKREYGDDVEVNGGWKDTFIYE
jgi:hypothetical protein